MLRVMQELSRSIVISPPERALYCGKASISP